MKTRQRRKLYLAVTLIMVGAAQANADIVGRLKFSVKDASNEKPIKGSKVTLTDPTGQKATIKLETDESGFATTPPIEARKWKVQVEATDFQAEQKDVTVVQDQTTDVEVLLEPVKEQVIKVKGDRILVSPGITSTQTKRDDSFAQKYPAMTKDPQSFGDIFKTIPGFVTNSVNQIHPRGEHSSTTVYMNGFQLPGAFQGRGGEFLSGTAIQSVDVLTGGFSPEYGSETAAILNVNLKSGTIEPFTAFNVQGGGYKTFFGNLTFGGQGGTPKEDGGSKPFSYLFDITHRTTSNALEPQDPNAQDLHNLGKTSTVMSKLDFASSKRDEVSLLMGIAPSATEVANTPALQASGQSVLQSDRYNFGVLSWRRNVSDSVSTLFSIGLVHTELDVSNTNPAVDLANLPATSTIDFNPTVTRNARNGQIQGSVSVSKDKHDVKYGFVFDKQSGEESYQLIPNSQDALTQLNNLDPRFAPVGNQPSTVFSSRDGYYYALYAQDTFKPTSKLSINYGLRFDAYHQSQDTRQNNNASTNQTVTDTGFSPRVNVAYAVSDATVLRASWNRLFTQPPLAQGSVVGNPITPQRTSLTELSLEKQVGRGQTFKVSAYEKDFTHMLDTSLLIGATQLGVYSTVNFDGGRSKGIETSYSVETGKVSSYLSWANSIARNFGNDNTGNPAGPYADHDQLNTISTGVSYALNEVSNAGLSVTYGSGLFSSFNGTKRNPRTIVDFSYVNRPKQWNGLGVQFTAENLFDERGNIALDSGFSGTRYTQGRRFLLSLSGKFK